MTVGIDSMGFFDLETGETVDLFYDQDSGRFYNSLTGDEAELVGDAINAARDTLIGIFGRQGYPQTRQQYPQQFPPSYYPQQGGQASPGSFSTQGLQIKWWGVAIAAALGGAILFGKRLGR